MQGKVEDVHADVDESAAAGECLGREPAPKARDPAAPQPRRAGVVDRTERAGVDETLEGQ